MSLSPSSQTTSMSHSFLRSVVAVLFLLVGTVVAHAQALPSPGADVAPQARRAPANPDPDVPFDWRAYFVVDSNAMAAKDTFDAVFGKTTFSATGVGGEVLNVWRRVFVRVAVSSMKESGERAYVFDGTVVPLGIPLQWKLRPVEFGAGWRLRPLAGGRLVPYVGGGLLKVNYEESSDFSTSAEKIKESLSGTSVYGGIEVRVAPWIIAGVEAQYRDVPDALGDGGLSKEFGDTNLGGTTLRFLVGVRR